MSGALLDWALEPCSGSVAADALSEGPHGVRSAVDTRQDKRMLSEGLDHDPHHDDIAACLGRLQTALEERPVTRKGSTTDGAALSPEPIRTVFGQVPHPLGPLQVLQELPQGVLQAVAKARERLALSQPALPRGRPSSTDKAARRLARKSQSIPQHITAVCQARFLFGTRRLTPSERQRLLAITRGLPPLRKLREIMAHLSALFDRRCHTQTALGKRKKLRQWVKRCTWLGDA